MTPPSPDAHGPIPQIFTLEEAAEILRVKKSWLEKKAAARRIPFSMLGGSYRFSPEHLWQIFREFEQVPGSSGYQAPPIVPTVRSKRRPAVECADPGLVPLQPRARRTHQQDRIAA
ncbi:helix-turn-helix domain-containing protein [Actinoplanes friuliensis]|uniref:helix-turn-helix domain-containing protein n=1 Tax=Actinoplanes friuliensis TaxID=196914 RepID=UPI00130D7506|nr:helix-turn-helix domain-containing protein [Actinoplanes friuliensis]